MQISSYFYLEEGSQAVIWLSRAVVVPDSFVGGRLDVSSNNVGLVYGVKIDGRTF